MHADEYYKAMVKASENWRRQAQEIARAATAIQPAYVTMLKDLEKSMVAYKTMQEQIFTFRDSFRSIESALGESIREANVLMSAVFESFRPYQDFAKKLQEDQRRWAESLRSSTGVLSQIKGIAETIKQDFTVMTSSALFALQSATRINLQTIGEVAKIAGHERAILCQRLIEMADSYRNL